ncbi:hypothetical protein [Luteimonas deserti]|uniref:Secreted protein n=1 Tax=Luteimonas deserti TaxID=2752306 RepID=A0A7Z0QSC8_9GAMM|nr:hypothetical protein [Luteimonas deserti]NYZ62895.1 hypothetical protein [Luteimonas deserti]
MTVRPLLCLCLLAACLPAAARDPRAVAPAEQPPCVTTANGAADTSDAAVTGARRPPAANASRNRAAPAAGMDSDSPSRGPRWHSFLPGMFR